MELVICEASSVFLTELPFQFVVLGIWEKIFHSFPFSVACRDILFRGSIQASGLVI
jgi:hypothetical protein